MERGSAIEDDAGDLYADIVGTGAHLTTAELRAWTRFLDASRLIEDILASHVSREHDMNHGEYEVLVRLDGAKGRMRMAQLASQVIAAPSRLTYTVDRLEARGWVCCAQTDSWTLTKAGWGEAEHLATVRGGGQ